jgi:hypothetical protein
LSVAGALSIAAVSIAMMLPDTPLAIAAKLGIVACYAAALVATGCVHLSELRALWPDGAGAALRRKAAVS